MKRSFVVTIIALLLLGCALTCGATTSIGYLPYNSSAFNDRTFDYKGHISYQIGGGGLVLNVVTHDADSCGNGECYIIPSPHETMVCKITSGPGHMPYTHWYKVKILRDGTSVAGPEFVECYHFSMYEWYCYRANHFGGNHDGLGNPQWGFKQIICDNASAEVEGKYLVGDRGRRAGRPGRRRADGRGVIPSGGAPPLPRKLPTRVPGPAW